MTKNLVNEYYYSSNPNEDNHLMAVHEKRSYRTKMLAKDLPEWYCNVHRYWWTYNMINCKGVVDLKYTWVRENHFMKDSVLRISYSGKIEKYRPVYEFRGVKRESVFEEYTNVGSMVFGRDVFKALAWIKKWSGIDLGEVRKEFVRQCEWLKENQPEFAPDTDDYGKWFDERLEKEEAEAAPNYEP